MSFNDKYPRNLVFSQPHVSAWLKQWTLGFLKRLKNFLGADAGQRCPVISTRCLASLETAFHPDFSFPVFASHRTG